MVRKIYSILEYHCVEPLDGGVNLTYALERENPRQGQHTFTGPADIIDKHLQGLETWLLTVPHSESGTKVCLSAVWYLLYL